jgi:CheY-like chemotaxis protein
MERALEARAARCDVDVRVRRPDGAMRLVSVAANIEYAHDGTPDRAVGMCVDVTEQRLMEGHAEDLVRRRDRYLAALARELRSPLAPLRNALAVLTGTDRSRETDQWAVEMMVRQVDQLVLKIDHLLDLSDIVSNRLVLRRGEVLLRDVLADAARDVASLYQEREVSLALHDDGVLVAVHADRARVLRALAILLANACRRCTAGATVQAAVETPGGAARIIITDAGRALSAAEMQGLDDLASVPTDKPDGGLEVGLPLATLLVKLNGGRLAVANVAGGSGVRWELSFPRSDAMSSEDSSFAGTGIRAGRGRRVLIADDSKDTANSAARVLKAAGHEVAVAYDGARAVEMARAFAPEFVLLDLSMPRMDGYEAAREIRESFPGGAPVLIAVTGWAERSDKARALAAGFDHHFAKPVDPQRLLQVLTG